MLIALAAILLSTARMPGDVVRLETGEELRGVIVEITDAMVVLEHPILGRLLIPAERIDAVIRNAPAPPEGAGHPEATGGSVAPAPASATAPAPEPAPEAKSPWTVSLELGFAGAHGNTETADARLAFLALRETIQTRLALDASYFYGEQNGDRSANRGTAGVRHDWYFPESPWFIFAQGRYDFDEFQSWDHRLTSGAGGGYKFVDSQLFTLAGRAGLGAIYEIGSEDEGVELEGILGLDANWRFTDRHALKASTTYYPNLSEWGEFHWVNAADWTMTLDRANGIDFKVGILDEYQSDVDPGAKHNDFKIYSAIVIRF